MGPTVRRSDGPTVRAPSPAGAGRLLAVGLVVLVAACDLTPDDRYIGLEGVGPFYVAAYEAGTGDGTGVWAVNQPITVQFNKYLDPDSFEYFNALTVSSGGVSGRGFSRYRLSDRTLTFFPTINLLPGLVYTVSVNPDTVRSLGGESLALPFSVSFMTTASGETVEQAGREVAPRSFEADVAPLLAGHCVECHDGEDGPLIPLTYEQLFADSRQTDPPRPLVLPFYPAESYLMHKVLPDYPDRRDTGMPPPWSDVPPLSLDEIGAIEDWIATGAGP